MTSKTRNLIQELRRKIKNPITGTSTFATDDAVIDLAVQRLYKSLKQQRLL